MEIPAAAWEDGSRLVTKTSLSTLGVNDYCLTTLDSLTPEDGAVPGLHPTYPLRTERLDLRPHQMEDLDDRNTASARLLERLGMRQEASHIHALDFKNEWANEYVYALLEDDWRAAQV